MEKKQAGRIFLLLCLLLFMAEAAALEVEIPVHFDKTFAGGPTGTVLVQADDAWFLEPSGEYDHRLARLSIGMAVSAFRCVQPENAYSDANLIRFFDALGFERYEGHEFNMKPSPETIASGMASRKLADGSLLIAVAVSGAGYEREWMSNLAVGDQTDHSGFSAACARVLERLETYMAEIPAEQEIRIWLTGYSRAAAVANLTAAALIRDGSRIPPENIFCYTFATPATTKDPAAYPQIHNICGLTDLVPKIPFPDWHYGRYGTTHYLPSPEVDTLWKEKADRAAKVYGILNGNEALFYSSAPINWFMGKFAELLYLLVPDTTYYKDKLQDIFITAYGLEGGMDVKLKYLMKEVSADEDLLSALGEEQGSAQALIENVAYTLLSELAGENPPVWVNDINDLGRLFHEHEPEVYVSWLLSCTPEELYDHPDAYTDLIWSGKVHCEVQDEEGQKLEEAFSTFPSGSQQFLSLPAGRAYSVQMAAEEGSGQIAARIHRSSAVSGTIITTAKTSFVDNEEVSVQISPEGEVAFLLGQKAYTGLDSVTGEVKLSGNISQEELRSFLTFLLTQVIPFMVVFLILLASMIRILLKRGKKHPEARQELHIGPNARKALHLISVLSILLVFAHAIMMAAYAIRLSKIHLGVSWLARYSVLIGKALQVYEGMDILIYLAFTIACFRARKSVFSMKRARKLALLLTAANFIVCIGAILIQMLSIPLFFTFILVFGAFVLFTIILRDNRRSKPGMELQNAKGA